MYDKFSLIIKNFVTSHHLDYGTFAITLVQFQVLKFDSKVVSNVLIGSSDE